MQTDVALLMDWDLNQSGDTRNSKAAFFFLKKKKKAK